MKQIIIIGNGISGVTAAIGIRRSSAVPITIISDEHPYFFSRTALMYVYMGHMKKAHLQPYADDFWDRNNIRLVSDRVTDIDFDRRELTLRARGAVFYDTLILATGSEPNKFGWPGQDLDRVTGLYHMGDLDRLEKWSKDIRRGVIVGGGLIGIELAEMLISKGKDVTFLVREGSFWNMVLPTEESAMINRHILEHGIDLRLKTELRSIEDNGKGQVGRVIPSSGDSIECQMVGLTAGVHPNIGWLRDTPVETNRGILVDAYLQTNIPGVYAIGDCAEMRSPNPGRRPVEAVWYIGRMMGETVAKTLCGEPTKYDPGIWFNSAKFLDIEYQVYGSVPTQLGEGQGSVYWEHPKGNKSIRLVYEKSSQKILGFNLMGIRFRHRVCEEWLREGTTVDEVVQRLPSAFFDPEFYTTYEREIQRTFADASSYSTAQ